MTNEELNRFLHEEILGFACYHESNNGDENLESEIVVNGRTVPRYEIYCVRCGASPINAGTEVERLENPLMRDQENYCLSLDAVRKVEEKVIEKVGLSEYCLYLQAPPSAIIATAEQRARACKAAIDAYTKLTGRV